MQVHSRKGKEQPSAEVVAAVRAELAPVRRQQRAEHARDMAAADSAIRTARAAQVETAQLRQQIRAMRARAMA